MATSLDAQLGFKEETTWGTAVTVDRFVPFLSETIKQEIAQLESKGIISGRRILASNQWTQGIHTVSGDIGMEVYDRNIGLFLKHALGTVSSSGTTAPFTHTFTPGELAGKGLTVQVGRPDRAGTVQPFTYAGCKVASWEIACAAGEIATLGISVVGKSETTSTGLASFSLSNSVAPMSFVGGSFTLASSSLCVRSVKFGGDNKLATDRRCIGQTTIDEPLQDDLRMFTGEVTLEFPDLVHYNRFVTGTEGTLNFQLARGTSSLTIVANVRTDGTTPSVNGRGMLVHNLNFSCVGSTTNDASAFTATFVTADTNP